MLTDSTAVKNRSSNSIADDLGEFFEPGNPGDPVRVKTWYLFIAEAFKLHDGIVAKPLRQLLPLYKLDPTSQPFENALEQWIRLFNFQELLIVKNENISANELLSRLAVEILGHWARHPRAAKRHEMPPRPATWTWAGSREEELSKITFSNPDLAIQGRTTIEVRTSHHGRIQALASRPAQRN
jgi:hypothetical protein